MCVYEVFISWGGCGSVGGGRKIKKILLIFIFDIFVDYNGELRCFRNVLVVESMLLFFI